MSTEFVAYIALFLSIFGNVALWWHSRKNRRALFEYLSGHEHKARLLVDRQYKREYFGLD